MRPLERIGSWIEPLLNAAGFGHTEKGNAIVTPVGGQITESQDLFEIIWGGGLFNDVHSIMAYRLYTKSDVLGGVVHRIAHSIAGFTLGLTTDDQDFVPVSKVVDFLKIGSEGYSKRRFFYEIATSYLLTNEAWVVLRGRFNNPPVSRTWLYPFDVISADNNTEGLPSAFRTVSPRDRNTYKREETSKGVRWLSDDGLNELVPILGGESINQQYRGQSPIAPLLYSVQQNVEGKRHNTSVLKNGLKLTGAMIPETGKRFDQKAMKDIKAAIQAMRGAATAGGTLVMPDRVESLDLAISNREMDYVQMLKEARNTIYNYYGVPLPLVSEDASTFNNFATAQTAYFDGAVFPVFDDIADALLDGLRPRFSDLEGAHLTYNENTIKALKGRNIERMGKARGTNSLSTNEIRETGGYEEVENGDAVLAPSTLIPIGSDIGDIPIDDPIDEPEPIDDDESTADDEV